MALALPTYFVLRVEVFFNVGSHDTLIRHWTYQCYINVINLTTGVANQSETKNQRATSMGRRS